MIRFKSLSLRHYERTDLNFVTSRISKLYADAIIPHAAAGSGMA